MIGENPISHIPLAWCQRTDGLERAFAQSDLHHTSTVKHLTCYAKVTQGSSILVKFLQILHRHFLPQFLFQRTSCLEGTTKLRAQWLTYLEYPKALGLSGQLQGVGWGKQ